MPDEPDLPSGNPFANLPMFGDIAKALSGQGPLNWDAARQFALLAATGGATEPNVDPASRMALQTLAPIVEMHVRDITGVDSPLPVVTTVTKGEWAMRTLDAYRPLFTELATSLARRPPTDESGSASSDGADGSGTDPMAAMMASLSTMMQPSMLGMAIGSMIGRMASRTFGQYDLPIPRQERAVLVVPATIDSFAAEWNLPVDEMRLWVLAQEMIGSILFGIPQLRDQYSALVRAYVGGFRPDPMAVAEHLAQLEVGDGSDPMEAMQRLFADPALLLGAVQSAEQSALAPQLDAAVAAVVGAIDYLVDSVALRVVGGDALRIAEAVRRRRVERGPDDVFIERLLGLHLTLQQVQRGKAFTAGAVDRIGEQQLVAAYSHDEPLPTPAEFGAPGLWLARLAL